MRKYDKEVSDFLVSTKGKAVALIVFDGEQGSHFEVRATSEAYLRRMPQALIEMASRIEGDLNLADLERKKAEIYQKTLKSKNSDQKLPKSKNSDQKLPVKQSSDQKLRKEAKKNASRKPRKLHV